MIKEWIELGLEIVIVLLGLYLAFFKSYFTEKGKNLATLEDIEEITQKVESIKTDFIRETEKLKLDIQYTNQVKFSIKNEEIKSLIDLYEKYSLWFSALTDFYVAGFNEDNQEILKSASANMDSLYSKFLLSEAKARLFIDNLTLFEQVHNMKMKTLELQHFIQNSILLYNGQILSEINLVMETTPITEQLEKLKPLRKEKIEFISNMNKKRHEHCLVIFPLSARFRRSAYNLLLSMTGTGAKVDSANNRD